MRYVYTMEYYSSIKKNAFESVLVRWWTLEPVLQSEVSQKEKILHINAYIWNLEKWLWWTFLQGRNGDTDIENWLVDPVGEGESRTNGESSNDVDTPLRVKQIAIGKSLCNTGSPAWCLWWSRGVGWGGEGGSRGRWSMYNCGQFTCFPSGSAVKNPPAMQETQVWSLGQEDLLEKGMDIHSSILAWEIPWTEEPGGLQSMWS